MGNQNYDILFHSLSRIIHNACISLLQPLDSLSPQTICCHPVLIEALQHMLSMPGCGSRDALKATFDAVDGLKISDHVPEDSKSDEALVALLDAAGLSFLVPLLAVRQEMARVVAGGKEGGEELAAWIEGNVKGDFLAQPGFVFGLFQVPNRGSMFFVFISTEDRLKAHASKFTCRSFTNLSTLLMTCNYLSGGHRPHHRVRKGQRRQRQRQGRGRGGEGRPRALQDGAAAVRARQPVAATHSGVCAAGKSSC